MELWVVAVALQDVSEALCWCWSSGCPMPLSLMSALLRFLPAAAGTCLKLPGCPQEGGNFKMCVLALQEQWIRCCCDLLSSAGQVWPSWFPQGWGEKTPVVLSELSRMALDCPCCCGSSGSSPAPGVQDLPGCSGHQGVQSVVLLLTTKKCGSAALLAHGSCWIRVWEHTQAWSPLSHEVQ